MLHQRLHSARVIRRALDERFPTGKPDWELKSQGKKSVTESVNSEDKDNPSSDATATHLGTTISINNDESDDEPSDFHQGGSP